MDRLEKQLLTALAEASGSVLENATLLRTLKDTKAQSAVAEEALVQSKMLREQLEGQRAEYMVGGGGRGGVWCRWVFMQTGYTYKHEYI